MSHHKHIVVSDLQSTKMPDFANKNKTDGASKREAGVSHSRKTFSSLLTRKLPQGSPNNVTPHLTDEAYRGGVLFPNALSLDCYF